MPFALWLVLVWVALWEEVSPGNVLAGVAVATALLAAFPRGEGLLRGRIRPLATARFVVHFSWKLVEASVIVAWEVVTPRNRINEGIVAVPIHGVSDGLVTVVANGISLTPGTLTLEVDRDPTVLYVHVLHLRDIEAVRRDVLRLEELAVRAFGSPADIARLGQFVDAGEGLQ